LNQALQILRRPPTSNHTWPSVGLVSISWAKILCPAEETGKIWGPVCVECLFFKDTGVQPHLSVGLISVRQKGGLVTVTELTMV